MSLILRDVWKPEDLSSNITIQHSRVVNTLSDLVQLGQSFMVAITGNRLDEIGVIGKRGVGKSSFVSGITGAWREHLTIDTRFVDAIGTVIHADLGNPSLYQNPIDLIELRRTNHAERHGKDCLKVGANILEHPGNCRWNRDFKSAVFVETANSGSEAREVVFAASQDFERTIGYQSFLERSQGFSRRVAL